MSEFHKSVARIHAIHDGDPDGPGVVLGAGFLVRPDLLVTCNHVLEAMPSRAPVRVSFPQADGSPQAMGRLVGQATAQMQAHDVAFLRLEPAPVGISVLGLRSASGPPGKPVRMFGFPAQAPSGGHPATARVGQLFTDDASAVLGLTEANALARGFSGSPVVDDDDLVVAMVTAHPGADSYGRGVDLAYAVPATILQQIGPGLRANLDCPYPGLAAFTAEQAHWYHGRTRTVAAFANRMRTRRGVFALLGPSGSGKSSLVAAGLLPSLAQRGLPGLTGQARLLRPGVDFSAISDTLTQVLTEQGRDLVVIDQFEELLSHQGDGADLLEEALGDLVRIAENDSPAQILIVLRDDFYPHLARRCPAVMDHLMQGRILNLTDQLSPEDLRDIITEPARSQNWNVDPVLTDRLIRDLVDHRTHGASLTDLPLLALTLRQIWYAAAGTTRAVSSTGSPAVGAAKVVDPGEVPDNVLAPAHYDTVGGVRAAFATWCDRVYRDLPVPHQAIARALLTSLVHDGDPTQAIPAVRRRRSITDLTHQAGGEQAGDMAAEVLDHLARDRIVTTSRDPSSGEIVVELAHDTLIEHWEALPTWLAQDRDQRRWLDRIEARARAWQDTGRGLVGLLVDDELTEALRRRAGSPVPGLVGDYIDASHDRQRSGVRARRRLQAALVSLTVLSLIATGFAYSLNRQATRARDEAIVNQVAAEADQIRTADASLAAQLDLLAHVMRPTPDSTTRLMNTTQLPLANPLPGHIGTVNSVSFSPNGTTLASGSGDDTIRLWDVADPAHPVAMGQPLTGHTGSVESVAFSPNGRTLASTGDDDTIRLWNVSNPALPVAIGRPLTGHTNNVYSVVFSPDGRTLASGSADDTIRLWNVADPGSPVAAVKLLTGHSDSVLSLMFSPDGRTLASGSADDTVRLWNVADPALAVAIGKPLEGHTNSVYSVVFSPDGRTLAGGSADNTIRLWNVARPATAVGEPLTGHTDTVYGLDFAPDGKTLASASADNTVRLWDVANPALPLAVGQPFTGHTGTVHSVSFSTDGRTLASGSVDTTVRLWSPPTAVLAGHAGNVYSVSFSPDGKTVVSGGDDRTMRLWNVADPARPLAIGRPLKGHTGTIYSVDFSPDGKTVVSGSDDHTIRFWNVADPARPRAIGQPLKGHTGTIYSVDFSPDGKTLVSGSADETVRLWDVTDPANPIPIGEPLTGHTETVYSVRFSPNGTALASGSWDDTVRLWDVANLAHPASVGKPLTGHTDGVYSVDFSPDGKTVVSGGADATVRLWDVADLDRPRAIGRPLTGPTNLVSSVVFSPDGRTLAGASWDDTIRLWTMADPGPRLFVAGQPLTGATDDLHAVAFSPDGRTLVGGGGDGAVRLWDRDVDRAIERICASSSGTLTPEQWDRYVPQLPYDPPCKS